MIFDLDIALTDFGISPDPFPSEDAERRKLLSLTIVANENVVLCRQEAKVQVEGALVGVNILVYISSMLLLT